MFYNFVVDPNDRDYLRFLWPDKESTIKEYRMTVHLFGATSSPAVVTYGLRRLAADYAQVHPQAALFIQRDFYVDDGVTSVSDVKTAKKLINDSVELCSRGKLRLHKFVSNSEEVMSSIPNSKRCENMSLFDVTQPNHRTLGLEWSTSSDMLRFTSNPEMKLPTRRGILSMVAQIYDPLGLLSPYTLQGKVILQQANQSGLDLDKQIPTTLNGQWNKWLECLSRLNTINIDRCYKPAGFDNIIRTELHHFADASFRGLGACSYIRLINHQDKIHVALLMGRSRVIPFKGKTTIPRLELQAAVLATRISRMLKEELDLAIDAEYFWSDSKIALGYIANDSKKFHIYIANRVHTIRQQTETNQWHYIQGNYNPADLASRGLDCQKLCESSWFHKPAFPQERDISQVVASGHHFNTDLEIDDPEVKRVKVLKISNKLQTENVCDRLHKFGSFNQLVKSVSLLQQMAKQRSWTVSTDFVAKQFAEAENFFIKITQQKHYAKEREEVGSGMISKSNSLLKLSPFINDKDVLRVGGRANNATLLSGKEKNPIIIPKDSHLARLLILHYHQKSHHLGKSHTLGALRQAGYWIVTGNRMAKEIVNKCVVCKKLRGPTGKQLMGELPEESMAQVPPFTNVGVDCFGHFHVKERRSELKR